MRTLLGIISRYIARNFFVNFGFLLCLLLFIVYILDTVELMRRGDFELSPVLIAQMGLFKLPEVGQIILPFAVLFSAMFTFWRLNRTSELSVLRSVGLSAVQFTLPMLLGAFLLGVFAVTVINPISSVLLGKYEKMENRYIHSGESMISISKSGLWLRQNNKDGGYTLIHATRLNPENWQLQNLTFFEFETDNRLSKRVQAIEGYLRQDHWLLNNARVFTWSPRPALQDQMRIETDLTPQDIIDTFASLENISFWKIPEFIKTLRETGFSTKRLEVQYQSLIAKPFLFAAMVLLAAAVSLRPPRLGGTMMLVILGVFIGFALFFSNSLFLALGISQKIPIFLAAWTPTIVGMLLGGSVLLQQEDG